MINQSHPWISVNGELFQASPIIQWKAPPVYEVMRLIDGIPLFFDEHIERLKHSLALMGYQEIGNPKQLYKNIVELAKKNDIKAHNMRLEMGVNALGEKMSVLYGVTTFYPDATYYREGVETVTTEIVRDTPHAKVINQAYLTHISQIKLEYNIFEVIIMDSHHKLAEGSKSNLFFVKGDTLYSAKSKDILMGITRLKILEVAKALSITLIEDDISLKDLPQFEACFISGTSIHILPVKKINDQIFDTVHHGVIRRLSNAFEALIQEDIQKTRRNYQ